MGCESLKFGFCLLVWLHFLAFAGAQDQNPYVCLRNGNYTRNSTYATNLNTLLESLASNMTYNGFYNASAGQNLDRVNAVVLCRGDRTLDQCRTCVRTAAVGVLQLCPNQRQAVIWYEYCTLRYSNEPIYGTLAYDPGSVLRNTINVSDPQQFNQDLRRLIDDLRDRAANGGDSLWKVAGADVSGPDFQTIYGLVQCTPDLSPEECNSCLSNATGDIGICCAGVRGARVLLPSCYLRFERYPFFNISRLRELGPRPAPGPGPPPVLPPPTGKGEGITTQKVIIIVVSIVGFVACLILAVFPGFAQRKRVKRKRREKHETDEAVDEISTPEFLQYSLNTIRAATNEFSDDNKLGQGGFGAVYKGEFSNGQQIAVKRLSRDSGQGDREFKNEVLLLARLQHRNLVRLFGFCLEGVEKLLVYEFVPNASLDLFIFDSIKCTYLDWDRRYKIPAGIARGILYLHEDSRLRIIHRDLKASNILLDGDMNPKIADFGMARLFGQDETQRNTSRIVGTYGYVAPEYVIDGQFSTKSDVFSFGVLILEIISGQRNNSFRSGENAEDLLSFAWKNWCEGTTANMVDPFLMSGSGSELYYEMHSHWFAMRSGRHEQQANNGFCSSNAW